MNSLFIFIDNHFEGIIAIALGAFFPLGMWIIRIWEKNIINECHKTINGFASRIDANLNELKEKIILLRENQRAIEEKQTYIKDDIHQDIKNINSELRDLNGIDIEVDSAKQMMSLHTDLIKAEFSSFIELIKEILKK